VSCGNCHLDGRSDGQSWLIHGDRLQTPMLCGRVANTAPFKWDGTAATLDVVLRDRGHIHGMSDGTALSDRDLADLKAYLESL
jgi:hypothetical protein